MKIHVYAKAVNSKRCLRKDTKKELTKYIRDRSPPHTSFVCGGAALCNLFNW